ncbi:phage protease [Oxalobacter aliiformigenes]|uniref:phage protease n=1 Tax=Oxalobacter aliiformigenes TaxID=2946593 RepID=UPI0022AF06D9|nr:phage protease [Oxalobacter aliiformigenes]MCZ4065638.1 phage protease [Oxalobacter aliiformigenes]WAV98348.1 phage protease [Oxalobacter aliiformigenes]
MPQIQIATLAVDLSQSGVVPTEVILLPPGPFSAIDGRPGNNLMWQLDADIAYRLIDRIAARHTDIVIDYDHQSLYTRDNGRPAPAAGWFRSARWDDAKGLIATGVKWTDKATDHIRKNEYRYVSAVFLYDDAGIVREIISVALTNTPALDNLPPLQAALSRYQQEYVMPQDHAETLNKLTEQVATLSAEKAQLSGQNAALTAERDALKKTLVDRDAAEAAIKAQAEEQEKNRLIEAALSENRLLPADRDIAQEMSLPMLKKFLGNRKTFADLSRQTKSKSANNSLTHDLTEAELAICSRMGCDPEQYAVTKRELAKRKSAGNDDN